MRKLAEIGGNRSKIVRFRPFWLDLAWFLLLGVGGVLHLLRIVAVSSSGDARPVCALGAGDFVGRCGGVGCC